MCPNRYIIFALVVSEIFLKLLHSSHEIFRGFAPQNDMKTIATPRHVESEYLLNIEIFLFKAIVLFEGKIIFALAIIYYLIFPEFTIAKKIEMY